MGETCLRFLLGGVIVSLFAVIGSVFKPASLAGIFGSAPSVAIVTLALAFATHGQRYAATVMAGAIAHAYGPETGGLFLAFPAILPASLTLVARHGGRRQAAEEAQGAILGAVALVAFAGAAWWLAERSRPSLTLATASATWILTALSLWRLLSGLRRQRRSRAAPAV